VIREAIISALDECPTFDRAGVVVVYLFGSTSKGTDRPGSDIDLAVLFRRPPESVLGAEPNRLEGELERALGRAVQVVNLHTAPPDLAIRVLRGGEILHEGDRSTRIKFEVRTRNVFFDLEPILRQYRRMEPAR
jgi:predicted nucleotidyltransferase